MFMQRILHINKAVTTGGAAIAAYRLFRAQRKFGAFDYTYFSLQSDGKNPEKGLVSAGNGFVWEQLNLARLALEKLHFLFHEKNVSVRFQYSMANTGINPAGNPFFNEADIYHLHWICQGFLSLKGLRYLLRQRKPVIWTLHDMWPFTGGCHYAGECPMLEKGCGNCPLLKTPGENDISRRQCKFKESIYRNSNLIFVAPSRWMAEKAMSSFLGNSIPCIVIPNTLDTDVFVPNRVQDARKNLGLPEEGFCLLFGAANALEERKGFSFLRDAMEYLKKNYPELSQRIFLTIFGKSKEIPGFPFPVYPFRYVADTIKLVHLYNAADVFLLPSLEDNLPNTVLEALSCGVPVVSFQSGGVSDMVDHHKTGFLAEKRNIREFAEGIVEILTTGNRDSIRENCRKKILKDFNEQVVVKMYDDLYQKVINP